MKKGVIIHKRNARSVENGKEKLLMTEGGFLSSGVSVMMGVHVFCLASGPRGSTKRLLSTNSIIKVEQMGSSSVSDKGDK